MDIALAIVVDLSRGRVLAGRRPGGVHLAFKWEFPGGKIEPGESPMECAVREALEETGLVARPLEAWEKISHSYVDRTVVLHPFLCIADGSASPSRSWQWIEIGQLAHLDFPEANASIIEKIGTITLMQ